MPYVYKMEKLYRSTEFTFAAMIDEGAYTASAATLVGRADT